MSREKRKRERKEGLDRERKNSREMRESTYFKENRKLNLWCRKWVCIERYLKSGVEIKRSIVEEGEVCKHKKIKFVKRATGTAFHLF